VEFSNVVDEFLDKHSLTYTRTTKQTNLTTLNNWGDEVDNLNTSLEDLYRTGLFFEGWWLAVNRSKLGKLATLAVDRLTGHVEHATNGVIADWYANWRASVFDNITALQAFSASQSNCADCTFA